LRGGKKDGDLLASSNFAAWSRNGSRRQPATAKSPRQMVKNRESSAEGREERSKSLPNVGKFDWDAAGEFNSRTPAFVKSPLAGKETGTELRG